MDERVKQVLVVKAVFVLIQHRQTVVYMCTTLLITILFVFAGLRVYYKQWCTPEYLCWPHNTIVMCVLDGVYISVLGLLAIACNVAYASMCLVSHDDSLW